MRIIFNEDKFLERFEKRVTHIVTERLAGTVASLVELPQFITQKHANIWQKLDDLEMEVKSGRIDVLNTKKDVEVLLGGLRAQEVRDRKGL